MSKYLVETYYTCSFKIVHKLDELNEKKLSELENRNDGEVQVIDVKLNNRKTKKIDSKFKTSDENNSEKVTTEVSSMMINKINDFEKNQINTNINSDETFTKDKLFKKTNNRAKMPDRRKGYIQKVSIGVHKIYLHNG